MLFTKKTDAETSSIFDVKQAILTELGNEDVGTERYSHLLTELERVCKLMDQDDKPWSFKPSADAVLSGGLTILSIVLITRHEQLNVITSKAMSFLPKLLK